MKRLMLALAIAVSLVWAPTANACDVCLDGDEWAPLGSPTTEIFLEQGISGAAEQVINWVESWEISVPGVYFYGSGGSGMQCDTC